MSWWKAELIQKASGAASSPTAAPAAYNDNDDLPF
jgi:hypothetical protein